MKHHFLRLASANTGLAVLLWCAPRLASAQATGLQITLSPYAGVASWDAAIPRDTGIHFGGRAGLGFCNWFGIEGSYGLSPHSSGANSARVNHVGADAVFSLTPTRAVVPYITGGWTQLEIDHYQNGVQTLNGWEAGGGLRFRLVERLAARIDARDALIAHDPGSKWHSNWIVTGGLHLALGGTVRDTDGDGVIDRKDRCPDTPQGATVDVTGCPRDTDGDGVWDGLDACMDTPHGAKVNAKGCPLDSDGDNVYDGIDACPDTPRGATVDARGCPVDTDGDGVWDGIDQCANTPTGAKVNELGCPVDSDHDGVYDGIDRCPDTPEDVRVDATGCPIEVNEKETQLLDTGMIRIDNIRFASGKWELDPESFSILDDVGKILSQWPQLQIEVGGHTDAIGNDKFNQDLSQKRAQAVLDYLRGKFPDLGTSQYTAVGYGESQPVAENKTAAGRTLNRRVEFKVLNRDVLKKEVEKRKLLRKD
jgi:OOP family OmpA-OmpF porin